MREVSKKEIKEKLKELGMRQIFIANYLKKSESYISHVLSGRKKSLDVENCLSKIFRENIKIKRMKQVKKMRSSQEALNNFNKMMKQPNI